jgi:hypothetical protein
MQKKILCTIEPTQQVLDVFNLWRKHVKFVIKRKYNGRDKLLDKLICFVRISGNKTKYMEGKKAIETSNLCTPSEIAQKLEKDQNLKKYCDL